jgi:carbamoyltransferase
MDHAYWGPAFGSAEITKLLEKRRPEFSAAGCSVEQVSDETTLCRSTAAAIADGQVVGWFQGRMEWGPRALGNRSILCEPAARGYEGVYSTPRSRGGLLDHSPLRCSKTMCRSGSRKTMPSSHDASLPNPVRRNDTLIPADYPRHDGSGRLQTVSQSANPKYYRLIESFRDLTAIPMVLNTSFNENEPVVCMPHEAIDCFQDANGLFGDWRRQKFLDDLVFDIFGIRVGL